MRRYFLRWLDGEEANVPGVTHAQVARAIERARRREPDAVAVLLWRQEPSSVEKRTTRQMREQYHVTDSTLGRRFDRAVRLVVEELIADLNQQRYVDDGDQVQRRESGNG